MTTKKKQLLYEQILDQLQGQIISGYYKKGDMLPSENELMESTGVSRITVRKALSILSEKGMIETSRGHGSEVIFSYEDIEEDHELAEAAANYRELFEASTQFRLMLEPQIAKQAALAARDEDIRKLHDIIENQSITDNDLDIFHQAIVDILHNKLLSETVGQLLALESHQGPYEETIPERQSKIHNDLRSQHKRILRAIEEHDDEFAYFYMKEHLIYIQKLYKAYFEAQM